MEESHITSSSNHNPLINLARRVATGNNLEVISKVVSDRFSAVIMVPRIRTTISATLVEVIARAEEEDTQARLPQQPISPLTSNPPTNTALQ